VHFCVAQASLLSLLARSQIFEALLQIASLSVQVWVQVSDGDRVHAA
jgi:hypothetical protein